MFSSPNPNSPLTGVPVSSSTVNIYTTTHHTVMIQAPPQFYARNPPLLWSADLFGCLSDLESCCITLWCPCITFGLIAEIVDKGSISCGASGALYTLIALWTGIPCIYSCFYRSKMRQLYNLDGNCCGDFLIHCLCEYCALCQEYRQLQSQGFDVMIGWHGNVERRNRELLMVSVGHVAVAPVVEQGMSRHG